MKPQGIVGLLLVIVGVLVLVFGGFSFTHREQVAKVGPLEVNSEKRESFPISPVIGVVCLVGGVVLLATGRK